MDNSLRKNVLRSLFKQGKVFKLVCGAGNSDLAEVKAMTAIYAAAGVRYFDVAAYPEVVEAAQAGLRYANMNHTSFVNVSVGIKGDPHVRKFAIDHTLCSDCGACASVCPQLAIYPSYIAKRGTSQCNVSDHKCIGCGKCFEVCKSSALIAHYSTRKFSEIIPPLIEMGIDSIEYHAVSPKTDEVIQGWNQLQELFPGGMLSYCIDRKHSGDLDFVDRIRKALKGREDWSTIIQADGSPMSGCDNDESTTLQALASAQLFDRMGAKAYLLLSGGTNARTGWLARMMGINYHGVSVGSYARYLVQKYFKEHLDLRYEDLYNQREIFDEIVNKVRPLVASI